MGEPLICGHDLLVKTFETLGVECVFGIPGSQDSPIYEALSRSSIRTVLATNELHAAFMANGYFRNSGKVGVVLVIAGPGFTNTVTGLAEAFFDSAGLVCIICKPSYLPGRKFQLQNIDEKEIIRTLVKRSYSIDKTSEISEGFYEAFVLAQTGEPGPVLVEVSSDTLQKKAARPKILQSLPKFQTLSLDSERIDEAIQLISSSTRAILYLGQGAVEAHNQIIELIDLLKTPVMTTTSGRGIVPESHMMSIPTDLLGDVDLVNSFLEESDLIIALGCKFTHNGSKGFCLNFPKEKLIHVDASPEVFGANYPARLAIPADTSAFLDAILRRKEEYKSRDSGWKKEEIEQWRQRIYRNRNKKSYAEPFIQGMNPPTAHAFFTSLREILPDDSCLVTDSGLHQMLARKYFEVNVPRGILVPSDFQSMGFGLPAGIGAKLSEPEKFVIVLTGDGGFAMNGLELSTAVREKIGIIVIIFHDSQLGLIRLHQLSHFGHSHAVRLGEISYSKFCEALGVEYHKLDNNLDEVFGQCLKNEGISLIEVELKDTFDIQKASLKGILKRKARELWFFRS